MFFDDELIAVGRKSNPKNNLSMNNALTTMKQMCEDRVRRANPEDKEWAKKNTVSCFNRALKVLYKEGYKLFDPEKTKLELAH